MRRPARSVALGGMLILAVISFLIYQGISSNLVYYITPGELLAKGTGANRQSFRLGGQVRPGSIQWNSKTATLRFVLQDANPQQWVRVVTQGVPPKMFRSGAGCVVEGTYSNHLFDATTLLIKHGSDYQAPKPGDTPVPDNFQAQP